jgi:hypothetical protein
VVFLLFTAFFFLSMHTPSEKYLKLDGITR